MTELKEAISYTVSEVAEALSISDDKARRLMHDGEIRFIWIGHHMRVQRDELLRIMRDGTRSQKQL